MFARMWRPRVGEWVEIRPADEILATLDSKGDCEGLPFMEEMLKYAGRRFMVSASAHKTCDTVNRTGGRRVMNAVHLADLRCNGSAHGYCQADCLLFWKSDWLKPSSPAAIERVSAAESKTDPRSDSLSKLASRTLPDGRTIYRCQATTLPEWSAPQHWWSPLQYWRDVSSGNASVGRACSTLLLAAIRKLQSMPIGFRLSNWIYSKAHQVLKRAPDPRLHGQLPVASPTPDTRMNLAVGEKVRIRNLEQINSTINARNRNRGLHIDEEMTRYCGQSRQVIARVTQIINEQTGEMMRFKNPCIVLENADCLGDYSDRRLLCPRRIRTYWREAWLERLDDNTDQLPHN